MSDRIVWHAYGKGGPWTLCGRSHDIAMAPREMFNCPDCLKRLKEEEGAKGG